MRTTLDIPENLLKRAKIEAVQRGTTLRELVGAALERELTAASRASVTPRRARFPIFASNAPGALRLTNARIAKLEAEEDARRHGRAR
ncbi:MAG: hypothetical protein A3I63_05735 [Betaproteobacteria bacterium RIFCSPLOWO2_02_FULL_66_14]|nr:MAG: hypothetical protein A3I63_05735 [Betaproteobacteria bacterium RIFCSPLOWO2_02_FULL_66_14]